MRQEAGCEPADIVDADLCLMDAQVPRERWIWVAEVSGVSHKSKRFERRCEVTEMRYQNL